MIFSTFWTFFTKANVQSEILSNKILKFKQQSSKLERHLKTKHGRRAEKSKEYLKGKGPNLRHNNVMTPSATQSEAWLKANCAVAARFVTQK